MLTIKHVDDEGRERVTEVVSTGHDPKKNELVGYGATGEALVRVSTGHAYVMNGQGKTVGVYSLRK